MRRLISGLLCLVFFASFASAATVQYVESTDGELSGNHLAPSHLGTFGVDQVGGTLNTVEGTVFDVGFDGGNPGYAGTADIFSFDVAPGTEITGFFIDQFSGSSNAIFMAMDDAATFEYSPNQINDFSLSNSTLNSTLAVWGIAGSSNTGGDNLLTLLGGTQDVLGPGTYTVYLQETSASSSYRFVFEASVTAVPEPGAGLFLGALSMVTVFRRRRRRVA